MPEPSIRHGERNPSATAEGVERKKYAATILAAGVGFALAMQAPAADRGWSLVETFVGARYLAPRGALPSPTRVSRFQGDDPARWRRGVPTFDRVTLGEPWPGISVDLAAHGGNVEKIFTVAPGADPARIEVAVRGALALRVDCGGALVVETGNGPVRFAAPRAYQIVDGDRRSVAAGYELLGGASYSFRVGAHVASLPLIIDPLLQSTYLGGSSGENATALTIEGSGNVLVAGFTGSSDFPGTSGGAQPAPGGSDDAFVASLTPDLETLDQATYLGGSGYESSGGIAIGGDGNVLVVGETASSDFPATTGGAQTTFAGGFADAYVASLTPDLTAVDQSTYLGGSSNEYEPSVAIDGDGNVLVAGFTDSLDFPGTTGGAQPTYGGGFDGDGFIARLTPDLVGIPPVIRVPALGWPGRLALGAVLAAAGALLAGRTSA